MPPFLCFDFGYNIGPLTLGIKLMRLLAPGLLLSLAPLFAFANDEPSENQLAKQCILNELAAGDESQTLAEVKKKCIQIADMEKMSAIDKRVIREKVTTNNPNVITPHKRNYILPVTYMDRPKNTPAARDPNLKGAPLDDLEAKFQLSLKVPLYQSKSDIDQAFYFGFTMQSYWQLYNNDISSPFRETNYQPEVFWMNLLDDENRLWGDEMGIAIGFEHQSNGRNIPLSRSWNRIYANLFWEHNGLVFSFKPWYRIPEEEKRNPEDPTGDDNPDIHEYMGHFEFASVYRYEEHEFTVMLRNNLKSDNKGAVQLDWSFPAWGRLRGYAQYYNGYGESLIDYNQHIERFGVGILLTDFL